MWLHSVARRAWRSTFANTRSPSCSSPRERLEHERLIVAEAHDVDHLGAAVAVLALDHAGVVDLAAAGGVERRLDELGQHAGRPRSTTRRDRRGLLGRLVAGEDAGGARGGRERAQLLARVLPALAAGAGPRPHALLLHQGLEALLVDAQARARRPARA